MDKKMIELSEEAFEPDLDRPETWPRNPFTDPRINYKKWDDKQPKPHDAIVAQVGDLTTKDCLTFKNFVRLIELCKTLGILDGSNYRYVLAAIGFIQDNLGQMGLEGEDKMARAFGTSRFGSLG